MAISKAQQKAVGKYESANYDKVLLRMAKGDREKIKAHATTLGVSLNAYIVKLIQDDMEKTEMGR